MSAVAFLIGRLLPTVLLESGLSVLGLKRAAGFVHETSAMTDDDLQTQNAVIDGRQNQPAFALQVFGAGIGSQHARQIYRNPVSSNNLNRLAS